MSCSSLKRGYLEFLPQEHFTTLLDGNFHRAGLVVKTRLLSTPDKDASFPRYYSAIFEKYGLPVYPIVVYSHDSPKKAQPSLYRVVQLNRLPWRRGLPLYRRVLTAKMLSEVGLHAGRQVVTLPADLKPRPFARRH